MIGGRNQRAVRTREAIIDACRRLMLSGIYRPPMVAICARAKVSIRSGFQHYKTVEGIWREAITTPGIRERLAFFAVGQDAAYMEPSVIERMVKAIVLHATHQQ